jgi:HEAT repeat protein
VNVNMLFNFHLAMMQKDTGVMELLRPLLLDTEPSVQQSAAMALGRLANYSEQLAERVVTSEILPQLVYSLSNDNVCSNNLSQIA